jgi:hypothetical protein
LFHPQEVSDMQEPFLTNPRDYEENPKRRRHRRHRRSSNPVMALNRRHRRHRRNPIMALNRRHRRHHRDNPASSAGIVPALSVHGIVAWLPIAATGGVSMIVTNAAPTILNSYLNAPVGGVGPVAPMSQWMKWGVQAGVGVAGAWGANKFLGKKHAAAWLAGSFFLIATDVTATYVVPMIKPYLPVSWQAALPGGVVTPVPTTTTGTAAFPMYRPGAAAYPRLPSPGISGIRGVGNGGAASMVEADDMWGNQAA